MEIFKADRIFRCNKKDLPDPDPNMDEKDVILFYSHTMPEMASAFINGKTIEKDKIVYLISNSYGTKG
jgi:PRTRC genetic system protein C